VLVPPDDVNDDTTSGEPYDDDDSRDNLSAHDDSHAPIIVYLRDVAHELIAPGSASVSSWIVPPSPTFLTSQRRRC
jgi:hypothetical protein